jgi:hypothetical protein
MSLTSAEMRWRKKGVLVKVNYYSIPKEYLWSRSNSRITGWMFLPFTRYWYINMLLNEVTTFTSESLHVSNNLSREIMVVDKSKKIGVNPFGRVLFYLDFSVRNSMLKPLYATCKTYHWSNACSFWLV